MRATVTSMLIIVAVAVLSLSMAGDIAGASTPLGLNTISKAWMKSCLLTGTSASTASFSCGLAAALLTFFSASSGCFAARGGCCCLAPAVVGRSLRGFVALWLARLGVTGGLALYVYILASLVSSLAECAKCRDSYLHWIAYSPRTTISYTCPSPRHLSAVPAGVETFAGVLCGGGLLALGSYIAIANEILAREGVDGAVD